MDQISRGVMIAKHQRSDRLAGDGGRHIARHDELLPLGTLRFHPFLRRPVPILTVGLLGDDAFQAQAAGVAQHDCRFGLKMLAEPQEGGIACRHDFLECGLAREKGNALQVMAVQVEQVEGVEHEAAGRSEEHTSELQSLMRISYAVFCLKKKSKYSPDA